MKQARRHQRRNTPPDAGSYFRRRRRRVFDWIHNVAKWTSDGPEEREDGSQRVLRHYRRNHLSLETLSAPLPLGQVSEQLQQALSEATYAPYQTRVDAFQKAMDATRVSWEVGRVELRIRRHHCLVYPRAHTCFNRVDLPLFGSREDLARAFDVALAAEHAAFSMD